MNRRITNLKNDIELFYKRNADTPRVALCFNMSLNNPNVKPGTYSLLARLFLQGTKNRSAEQLAEELDMYAIEVTTDMRVDYLTLRFLCLNEDFEKALEIFEDIIKNSTFEDYEKEKLKLVGEIQAQLDAPRAKVIDNYYKNIYANHHYGSTNTVVLECIESITKQDIVDAYNTFMNNSKKVISLVGDMVFDDVYDKLNSRFGDIPNSVSELPKLPVPTLNEVKKPEIIKPDANQAHILQGWIVDNRDDYPALALLNIMLGASGLSSRLFLELREKKGLAYVVRSSYDVARLCANFSIYIATEPNNIEVSINGFKEEIDKVKNILVSEEELENAKNNLFGKWAFSQEDNSQQAATYAHYAAIGLGFEYNEKIREKIRAVTPEQIKEVANKYFGENYVLSIIKP